MWWGNQAVIWWTPSLEQPVLRNNSSPSNYQNPFNKWQDCSCLVIRNPADSSSQPSSVQPLSPKLMILFSWLLTEIPSPNHQLQQSRFRIYSINRVPSLSGFPVSYLNSSRPEYCVQCRVAVGGSILWIRFNSLGQLLADGWDNVSRKITGSDQMNGKVTITISVGFWTLNS